MQMMAPIKHALLTLTRKPRRDLWIVAGCTAVATVLMFANLTARSMWLDDGLTLERVARPWLDVLSGVLYVQGLPRFDDHPPVYFLLFKAWVQFAGSTDFAIKSLAGLAGIAIVPSTYVLARRLFGRSTGLIAAFLALSNPAYIWYGQELRMYTLVPGLAALSTYCLFQALTRGQWRFRIAWLCVSALAIGTHYSFAGFIAVQALFVLVSALLRLPARAQRRMIALGGIAVAVTVITAIAILLGDKEWLVNLLPGVRQSSPTGGVSLDAVVFDILGAGFFGLNAADPSGGVFNWLIGAVCVLGVLLPSRQPQSSRRTSLRARLLLATSVAGPILLLVALSSLRSNHPTFRHFILTLPLLHVLIANAVVSLATRGGEITSRLVNSLARRVTRGFLRSLGAALFVMVLAAQTFGVVSTFTPSPTWQDDWRGVAHYIRDHWRDGDIFLVNIWVPDLVVATYLQGTPIVPTPMQSFLGQSAEQVWDTLAKQYKRIWYVHGGGWDPDAQTFEPLIVRPFYQREHVPFPSRTTVIDLLLFETQSPLADALPATAMRVDANSSAAVSMVGYEIKGGSIYNPHPNMQLVVYWQQNESVAVRPALADYSVSIRLSKDDETWLDWYMPAQLDAAPTGWSSAGLYRTDYLVPVPLGLPALNYALELTLRAGEKSDVMQRSAAAVDAAILDCCVRVVQWPQYPSLTNASIWRSTDVTLMASEFPAALRPGEFLPVVLLWQVHQAQTGAWQTALSLDGLLGGNAITGTGETGDQDFPVSAWPAHEPVRDMTSLQLPYNVSPGWYRLSLQRIFSDGRVDGTFLGLVEIKAYPHSPVPQDIPQRINARVGELQLLGYSLPAKVAKGALLEFHTYWRIETAPTRDGVLFLHLLDATGKPMSQDDSPPERGNRSTLTYRPGEGIDQTHRLIVPADAPAGEYLLYAGIYNRTDVTRWPAQQDDAPARDDLVYLGKIHMP
ncbi:MAG: glycosyltransferase family 39 protein [Chloroflexi bacterium]|nr:glycosyltransferase family 39 protein [Chloroflexota bacterium]